MIDFSDSKTLNSKLESLFNKLNEIELLVIKCHLLVEFAINEYITLSTGKAGISKYGFSFSQKIKICKLLGLFDLGNIDLQEFVASLNNLRNQVAHTFSYDESQLEKLCLYSPEEKALKKTFLKRQLKTLSSFYAGRIIGRAQAKGSPSAVKSRLSNNQ